MNGDDGLIDGVRTLLEEAAGLPVRGLGVVRQDGPTHVVLTYVDPLGVTAYRAPAVDLPESVRPRRDRGEVFDWRRASSRRINSRRSIGSSGASLIV